MDRHKHFLNTVLIFSLAFNIAFVGIWLYHMVYVRPRIEDAQRQRGWRAPVEALADARLEELRLTPEQRRRIVVLRQGLRPEVVRGLRDVGAAREEFLVLLQDPSADPQRLRAVEQKIAAEQERLRGRVVEHLIQVRDVLDPQQREELARILAGPYRMQPAPGPVRQGPPLRRLPPPEDREVIPEDKTF